MDLNDMTPAGGGDLRSPAYVSEPAIRQTVGTFTATASPHPDTIWSPRGGELAPPDRPLDSSRDASTDAESERLASRVQMGEDLHRTVRAALRPGIVG